MEQQPLTNGNSGSGTATTTAGSAASVAPATTTSKLSQLAESLKLEHQLLRVPFEHYKKTIRATHRSVEKEVSSVISAVSDAADGDPSQNDAVEQLNSLVSRLQESADAENLAEWNKTRLNRVLVDYMLRMSYYDTAMKLAETSNIRDLVDIDVFQEARRVIEALQSRDVAPALAWCAENKSRLKKSKSKFEFQLRLQEFIELVRAENNMRAITYARKHLAQWGSTHMKELQRALFEPKQWDFLVDQFKQEFCKLYGMTLEPLLNIFLQAGLSALKTPFCYEDDCTKEDPLSQESFRKLALPLPFSKQHHSKLVCYITKELMDTENPPLVLPNGYVYSTKALEDMARRNNGKITCPRTGLVCSYTDLVKAYIS
ncbi:CTLH/CRA C-terminal to LisH motif domain [Dillenia turbinata]|uniref:CTLH/CRA C-terminal to LisH motif domain n=1 Tax=Dillenia turbinata TaxID=194707 RepID=A0AAN8VKW2_9MAGN